MGNWKSGLKFGREKGARGWLITVSGVMVMNDEQRREDSTRRKGSPGRSTEAYEYLRRAQKMFLQIEMKEKKLTWWREASGKKGK